MKTKQQKRVEAAMRITANMERIADKILDLLGHNSTYSQNLMRMQEERYVRMTKELAHLKTLGAT